MKTTLLPKKTVKLTETQKNRLLDFERKLENQKEKQPAPAVIVKSNDLF